MLLSTERSSAQICNRWVLYTGAIGTETHFLCLGGSPAIAHSLDTRLLLSGWVPGTAVKWAEPRIKRWLGHVPKVGPSDTVYADTAGDQWQFSVSRGKGGAPAVWWALWTGIVYLGTMLMAMIIPYFDDILGLVASLVSSQVSVL